jgi:CheY-like chemotaxis protein
VRRILVVDDEQLVADTLGLIFRKHDFDARVAYSGEEALSIARTFGPELILCDITMPGFDGLQLMKTIAREFPECHVLVLTGHHQADLSAVRDQARKMPRPVGILTKPCNPAELLRHAGAILASA